MKYLSVCSGIEAVSVAWQPLGWQPAMFAEIDPFCVWLLRSRYGASRPIHMPSPNDAPTRKEAKQRAAAVRSIIAMPTAGAVSNFGDFTRIGVEHVGAIDLLAGGTPCQSFSIAGKRVGLDDPRGNLTIEFARLAGRLRPLWLVWENVPGTASTDIAGTLQRDGDGGRADGVMTPQMAVRRLTPRECERLQGLPDDYTLVEYRGKLAADGPRYKALGNSMAVPVMRWIGQRIAAVDAILRDGIDTGRVS